MSAVSKVIVDQKGSNSLLYLPLDKIIGQKSELNADQKDPSQAANQTSGKGDSASDVINSITERSRGAFRARERDSR